ncbi:hypothetical protein [Maritimibacter sp. 55A14]|uniref:hypothetical protein n=1 Tax=Maritimibacter sp. 55A14 TaxID=2174844 RepID=UPI001304A49D|nr:hypothetical protein [Maritimibacter sp. 55A14]
MFAKVTGPVQPPYPAGAGCVLRDEVLRLVPEDGLPGATLLEALLDRMERVR